MKAIVRFGMALFVIVEFMIASVFSVFMTDKIDKRRYASRITSWYARKLLSALHIHVRLENRSHFLRIPSRCLVYANHQSYLDVLALAASVPCVFVTSLDVGASGIIGILSRMAGAVFIDRRNINALRREVPILEGLLGEVGRITVFPEGTSSDGSGVLPFKASLTQAAVNAKVPLVPVRISYIKYNGVALKRADADRLLWYGDMTFFDHLFRLCSIRSAVISLRVLDKVSPEPGVDRKTITAEAYSKIVSVYTPI
jgi:1-acyl-sn-glycerol-3-phosphate acyltransferase